MEFQWNSVEYQRNSSVFHWIPMEFHGNLMEFHRNSEEFLEFQRNSEWIPEVLPRNSGGPPGPGTRRPSQGFGRALWDALGVLVRGLWTWNLPFWPSGPSLRTYYFFNTSRGGTILSPPLAGIASQVIELSQIWSPWESSHRSSLDRLDAGILFVGVPRNSKGSWKNHLFQRKYKEFNRNS